MPKEKRNYVLKPGHHQFHPRCPANHTNENTSDVQLAQFLEYLPHIRPLFIRIDGKPVNRSK